MLFNSVSFIFCFLPLVLVSYYILRRTKFKLEIFFLSMVSLIFYSWNDPIWIFLILFSIITNYFFSIWINRKPKKIKLILGIIFNITLIAWFKYRYFLFGNILFEKNINELIVPLAISFFTFQQISLLVDINDGRNKPFSFINHLFYVSFFPQLISGPIVLAKEMTYQIEKIYNKIYLCEKIFTVGIFIFFVGLFKKVFLADNIAPYVYVGFNNIHNALTFPEAWSIISAFALQLYFDFSGYSEMAVGLGLLFGFRLPVNFNVPYKSSSIIEFWKRWHITVTNFFMLYLYAPFSLFINRLKFVKNFNNFFFLLILPTLFTFFVSGLWHGADWKYVYFGLVNGIGLIINHLWKIYKMPKLPFFMAWLLTVIIVLVSFVFFRAHNTNDAIKLISIMFNPTIISLPYWVEFLLHDFSFHYKILPFFNSGSFSLKFFIIFAICCFFAIKIPNVANKNFQIKNNWKYSFLLASLVILSFTNLNNQVTFIYFQF